MTATLAAILWRQIPEEFLIPLKLLKFHGPCMANFFVSVASGITDAA